MAKLMNEEVAGLRRLQKLLRDRAILFVASKGSTSLPRRVIQEIAELESGIVATDAVLQEG